MDSRIFYHLKVNAAYKKKIINKINITMKTILICFLCFLCLTNAQLVIIEPTCNSVECNFHLTECIRTIYPTMIYEEDNGELVSTISHKKLIQNVGGLYARAFTKTNGEIEITDFTKTDDASNIYLHVRLTLNDIRDTNRCKEIFANYKYFYRECLIVIKYYNTARNLVIRMDEFSPVIREPRFEILPPLPPPPLLLTFKTKIYRGDCKNELCHKSSLSYGELVCLGIFGDNDISKSFQYEITSLLATYSKPRENSMIIDMLNISVVNCSFENTCVKGQIYIKIPMIYMGHLEFNASLIIKDLERALTDGVEWKESEAVKITFPGVFEIDGPYSRFIYGCDNNDDSFGSSVAVALRVALSTLIAVLMILL